MKCFILIRHLYDLDGEKKLIGGIETYLVALSQVMIYNHIEPFIVQQANNFFEKEENGIHYLGYDVSSKKLYQHLYDSIKKNLSEEDLIVWGLDRDSIKVPHKRTISIQHGIPFDYYPLENKRRAMYLKWHLGKVFKWAQRRMAIKAFENARYKVCVDYNFWNWYRTFCLPGEEKDIFVIPNFAELTETRKEINEDGVLRILFARRFVRMRGVEVFIDVVKKLANEPGLEFTFAGEGPYLPEIEELVKSHNNVKITKYNPAEAVEFHTHYDVAVVPTIASEGTSLSLLEAMSAGDAVIATCVGGMTNIILDGFNGIFVRPYDSDKIVNSILRLKNDRSLLQYLSNNAQETVNKSFSYEIWRDKWSAVIKEIIVKG